MERRRERLAIPRGRALAWHPKSWDDDFDFIAWGDGGPECFREAGPFAIVDVCGPLVQHAHWYADSYEAIRKRVASALASGQPQLLLYINSPGGDWQGCEELSRELRKMVRAAGKRFTALTDAQCSSGGYGLACAADEIVLTDSALVGSIGIWLELESQVERLKAHGIERRVLASGARKTDGNPSTPITAEAEASTQDKVDTWAARFYQLVSEHRGIPVGRIAGLEGNEFIGAKAVAMGLADRVSTFSELTQTGPRPSAAGPSGAAPMAGKSKAEEDAEKKKAGDDEWAGHLAALHAAAEGEDEERAAAAKRMLAAMYPKEGEGGEKKEEEEQARANAKVEEEREAAAKALAASNLELAREVQTLKADAAQRKVAEAAAADERARAAIFAKRPDLGDEVRKALAMLPTQQLEKAIQTFPRINASPGGTLNAQFPVVTPGNEHGDPNALRPMTPEAQALFDKTNPFPTAGPQGRGARMVGRELVLDELPADQSRARADELAKTWGFR